MGYYKKKKKPPIDNISVSVDLPVQIVLRSEDWREYLADLEVHKEIIAKLQKTLRTWWRKQTTEPFILVVVQNGKAKIQKKFRVRVELTQLNLKPETIEKFTEGVKEIINSFDVELLNLV